MGAVTRARPLVAALLAASLCLAWAPQAEGARILAVFGHVGKSHWDVFEPLMQELARRGHQLVVISHFPQAKPRANYTDISLEGTVTDFSPVGQIDVSVLKVDNMLDVYQQHVMLSELAVVGCDVTFGLPDVQKLLRSDQKFDLLITELFTTDCYLALAHHYKIPHIVMSSCNLMPWAFERFGIPQSTAYAPDLFHQYGIRMTFWERLQNTWKTALDKITYEYMYHRPSEKAVRKYFKDLPPIEDIAYNVSMMFVNTHSSLTHARPLVPAVVEVAGIHLPPSRPLPKDIKDFLDGSKEGAVYFNMGSMIRATSLQPAKRQAFLQAFERLGLRVLWKWEEQGMPGQPANVKTSKWTPQYDVLSHPNVKVYIGHGGLLGSIEAAHTGVPMLAIPIFGDQRANVQNLVEVGLALKLEYADATADTVFTALKELLENPRYQENAKRISRAFRDRPQSPLDAAVYWTEYVLRHNGARHLRSIAVDLPWYQRWLLDVLAASAAGVALVLLALRALLRRIFANSRMARKLKGE